MESVAAQAQAETQSELPLSNNAMSALGYFCGLVAIGALFIKPYDKNKEVRFHAIQAPKPCTDS